MDHNIGTAASPELPPDHSYPNPNVSHMVNMQNAASYHHLLMQKQQQQPLDCTTKLRESINVKPLIKSEHGLEHPPYTPVPGTVREITKLRKQDPLESTDGYTTEKQIIESIKNGGHGRIDMKIDPGIGEYEVMDTESFLEKQHKSTDSSESTDSKRNSYPKYEKNDSTPSELIGQLRPFHSTQSRLETAPFNKGLCVHFYCIHRIASGGYYGLCMTMPPPPPLRFSCYTSRGQGIIGRLFKVGGYIQSHKILPGSIFGHILKTKLATTGIF